MRSACSELGAVAKLGELSQTGVFADALAASAVKKTAAASERAVTNPVETISGIPAGVGRFFQSTSYYAYLASQTPPVTSTAAQASAPSETAEDLLGVNKAKRQIAKQVDADPYTTNPVLAKQLEDLARAAFAGGVSLDVVMGVSRRGRGDCDFHYRRH